MSQDLTLLDYALQKEAEGAAADKPAEGKAHAKQKHKKKNTFHPQQVATTPSDNPGELRVGRGLLRGERCWGGGLRF